MPQVSKTKMYFAGMPFDRTITVNGHGQFMCLLPEYAQEKIGYGVVQGETKKEVENKFAEASRAFQEAKSITNKIIIYTAKVSAHIMDAVGDRILMNRGDVSFTTGLALDVSAVVCNESIFTSNDNTREAYRYTFLKSSIPSSMVPDEREFRGGSGVRVENQMPWTQEREDFFAKLGTAMQRIAIAIGTLDNPKSAMQIADSGEARFFIENNK